MTTMVQIEFRENLLSIRDEILQSLRHPVISALGSRAVRNLDLAHESVGVVLIGHSSMLWLASAAFHRISLSECDGKMATRCLL
jgi:hypothetical protein